MINNIDLNNLSSSNGVYLDSLSPVKINKNDNDATRTDAFSSVLGAALDGFNKTNDLQKIADTYQQDFASGKTDNMLAVMMAEQKALTSLDLTVQLTSKVVESYREIMRIQL